MRILIVEDESSLREALSDLLRGEGHDILTAGDGAQAVEVALAPNTARLDLVLLDLMLPGMDGLEVCRRLRERRPDLGILMLTAKGSESDKVRGLREGADDYITKPFGAGELLARIDSVARRTRAAAASVPEQIEVDGCRIDLGRCRAERDGTEAVLTAREARLLRYLLQNRARAVSRGELLERVWNMPPDLQTRTIDMAVANLRQKIEADPREPRILVTVKGVGYAWGGDP
jgi:two-component system response regulator RegX3